MADPEMVKGDIPQPGQGEQLPQGAATAMNEANPVVREEPVKVTPPQYESAPEGYDAAQVNPGNDELAQMLFADPDTPRPPAAVNPGPPQRVPNYIVRQLPMMRAALDDPAAPLSLKAAYRAIIDRLRQEYNIG